MCYSTNGKPKYCFVGRFYIFKIVSLCLTALYILFTSSCFLVGPWDRQLSEEATLSQCAAAEISLLKLPQPFGLYSVVKIEFLKCTASRLNCSSAPSAGVFCLCYPAETALHG